MIDDPQVRGARLRRMRERAGLKQVDLGKALGVTRSHIGLVENGRAGVSVERLQAWVEACGSTMSELFASEGTSELTARIDGLPPERSALVEQLVDLVEWSSPPLVSFLSHLLTSLEASERDALGAGDTDDGESER